MFPRVMRVPNPRVCVNELRSQILLTVEHCRSLGRGFKKTRSTINYVLALNLRSPYKARPGTLGAPGHPSYSFDAWKQTAA